MADDAALAEVRELLRRATAPAVDLAALGGVVWFCVCESMTDQMPVFVIDDGGVSGSIRWQELPDGVDVGDVTDRTLPVFGGHVDPQALRDCLTSGTDPCGDTWGDVALLTRLQALVQRR